MCARSWRSCVKTAVLCKTGFVQLVFSWRVKNASKGQSSRQTGHESSPFLQYFETKPLRLHLYPLLWPLDTAAEPRGQLVSQIKLEPHLLIGCWVKSWKSIKLLDDVWRNLVWMGIYKCKRFQWFIKAINRPLRWFCSTKLQSISDRAHLGSCWTEPTDWLEAPPPFSQPLGFCG